MSGRMVLLSSAQWRSGLVVSLSGVLAKSGGCAVDEMYGDEKRVRRGRVYNWTLLLEVLSTGLGTRSPVWIPIVHDGLEMRATILA